jgi:VanZ family protein
MILRIFSAIPLVLYSLLIFYLSSLSNPHIPDFGFSWQDKVIHAGAFFVYGVVLQLFLAKTVGVTSQKKYVIFYLVIGCFFGASDEFHQYFVPGRSCELLDWLADTIGLLLSFFIVFSTTKLHFLNTKQRLTDSL